jgi:hypothetical protein
MKKIFLPLTLAAVLAGCGFKGFASVQAASVSTQQQAVAALRKLHFMTGSWRCVVHGGLGNGYVSKLSYAFSPDGLWMSESESAASSRYPRAWSMQMWGYDALHKSFDAYQFTPQGVFTKTVQGWQNGKFVSTRDDNQAIISIRPGSSRAFEWLIQTADKSSTVTETCTR